MALWLSAGVIFTFLAVGFVLFKWGKVVCVGTSPATLFTFIAILFTSGLDVGLIMFPLTEFGGYADISANPEYSFTNPLAPVVNIQNASKIGRNLGILVCFTVGITLGITESAYKIALLRIIAMPIFAPDSCNAGTIRSSSKISFTFEEVMISKSIKYSKT